MNLDPWHKVATLRKKMRSACPRFGAWLARLEALGR